MSDRYSASGALTLDTNVLGAVTATFEPLIGSKVHDMFVASATGTHTTHQVKIEGSPDEGVTWIPMWTPVTGEDVLMGSHCLCPLIRGKVVVAEGGTSTCNIYFFST